MNKPHTLQSAVNASPASAAHQDRLPVLMLGAIGVVYGDIGTSPLYAMKESFIGPHRLAADPLHIFGVLSLIFWSLMLIVTVKYVLVAMRADNRGEGGSFALLALLSRHIDGPRTKSVLLVLALWRERLFAWMVQASESAMDYYRLPANRVVELGSQLRI